MRKLIVAEHISLDGVVQSPGAPEEDPSGGFRLGGWSVPYTDEAIGQAVQELLSQPFELLLGRRTYEIFAAYWPRVGADSASHRRAWARQALVRRQRPRVGLHPGALDQHVWRCADHPLCARRRGAHRDVRRG
jgi:dihydrofolate reductase